jgi:RimJ/RimL family protein N-acetyltransferase
MIDLEIITKRLKLYPLLEVDATALYEYRSDADVCKYQSFEPGSLDDVKKFISGLEHDTFGIPDTWVQFGIRLRECGLLVGDLGVHFIADKPNQVEIGLTLDSNHQGNGYATEAVKSVLEHLFVTHNTHRVFASVDPRNEPCISLLERVGMRREAHFHQSMWFKGEWVDDVVFGILESEWKSR